MTKRSDSTLGDLIPPDIASRYQAVPLREEDGRLFIGFVHPSDRQAVSAIYNYIGRGFEILSITPQDLEEYLGKGKRPSEKIRTEKKLGQVLLEMGVIDQEILDDALRTQQETGARLGQILASRGDINQLALSHALALQFGMRHINLRANPPDPETVKRMDPQICRDLGVVPVRIDSGTLVVALADPTQMEKIEPVVREIHSGKIEFGVTSAFDIEWVTRSVFHEEYMRETIWGLFYREPEESAYRMFTPPQLIVMALLAGALAAGLVFSTFQTLLILNIIFTLLYLTISIFRFWISYIGAAGSNGIEVTPQEIAALDEESLPEYTILVPVYKEKEVLPRLLQSLDRLDYPKSKLDVKLLFEEVDEETIAEARKIHPPAYIEFITVPDAQPRTKPKACNYGLISARGRYLVIYDAEDRPEPDQLKKVIIAYSRHGEDLVCIQARLNYFNRNQNILTRWFTCEYSNWFDMLLPGLDRNDLPIPLGGTSNHFVTEKLRKLGGWDPFNVTEDADLGIRMYKHDYKTAVVDSTTYEEANSQLWNWIRQRTRWIKGYMLTWFVNMRRPFRLLKDLGLKGTLGFHLVVGGTPFLFIINPIFWTLTSVYFLLERSLLAELFPPPVFLLSAFNLIVGNFIFVYLNIISSFRRGYYELGKYALLSPLYWVLMSVAAWRALWQLIFKPFYWEKTTHGLHTPSHDPDLSKQEAG